MSRYTERASCYVKQELNLSEEKREVLAYGMETFIAIFLGFLGIVVFGYLFGLLGAALIISLTALVTRVFTGGAHCSSMGRCTVVTIIVFTFLAYLTSNILTLSFGLISVCFIVAVIFIAVYAPVQVKEKPISEPHRRKLKKGALGFSAVIGAVVILSYFVFDMRTILYITTGFLWQSFTITPLGIKVIAYIDDLLKLILKGGEIHEKT
ncbi:MAG: hypothetical protein APF76_11510 [Desulfitibacter sp. BRH_c19]|nr:MAG: hypothetical protein APF76_11510 [Desulfitibacter sp. BRH_c19]